MNKLNILPCLDSDEMAAARRWELDVTRSFAQDLGRTAVEVARAGTYITRDGKQVLWRDAVKAACAARLSIPPEAVLPPAQTGAFAETTIQVSNETTLGAARRMADAGLKPVALNFANGIHPGGGFLGGSKAQEEVLCRSSALYETLLGDPMYERHRERTEPDSTDSAIWSPDVPVFRTDEGTELPQPWLLSFITCAAPVAQAIGKQRAADLLRKRIDRVLAIAHAYGRGALVLGAWGCGAFGNDPHRTATDFRQALETHYAGAFAHIIFAIADWSPQRKFLGPFRDVFATAN
jgi:uncharacterized protein (TIGR02452 family)